MLHFLALNTTLFSFCQLVYHACSKKPSTYHDNNSLALIVLLQYIPRLYVMFPLSSQILKATGVVTKTSWADAAYNLLLYMLASHVCNSLILFFISQCSCHRKSWTNFICIILFGGHRSWVRHGTCCQLIDSRLVGDRCVEKKTALQNARLNT